MGDVVRDQRRVARSARASMRRGGRAPLVLSLCDASGVWSEPYRAAGFEVRAVDLAHGDDVRDVEWPGRSVYAVLAAPPCTKFSRARGRPAEPEELRSALAVVDACLRVVVACRPAVWALENPPGQLDRFLGPPVFSFDPWEFGDAWTKRTYLWGSFREPERSPVVPVSRGVCGRAGVPALGWDAGGRSRTPEGFARAFFAANSGGVVVPGASLWSTRVIAAPRM